MTIKALKPIRFIVAGRDEDPCVVPGLNDRQGIETLCVLWLGFGRLLVPGLNDRQGIETLREDMKIWTAEDPVEITQKGLRQVQAQPKIDFTFAAAMRSFLRADPDVIMVGEMRDHETAAIGIEASLTGHLVFSTLHTNSAPETITRLLDMNIDPFNFADALLGIMAQRLIRTLCPKCKEGYHPDQAEGDEIVGAYGAQYFPHAAFPYTADTT